MHCWIEYETSTQYMYMQYNKCVCVSFPPASASYILLQFAQYGNILKHTVRWNTNMVPSILVRSLVVSPRCTKQSITT